MSYDTESGFTVIEVAEEWREYRFYERDSGARRSYWIDSPRRICIRPGGSTHRVLDADGVVHIVPAIGVLGCIVRCRPISGSIIR